MRLPASDHGGESADVERVANVLRGQRGLLSPLYGALLHSPPVAEAWSSLGLTIRTRTQIDARTRELLICLVARLTASEYEWSNHAPLALAEGVTSGELAVLPEWRVCPSFSGAERVLLDFVEGVVRGDLDDAGFEAALGIVGSRGVVEVAATVAYYVGVASFLSAVGIDDKHDAASSSEAEVMGRGPLKPQKAEGDSA